MFEYTTHGTCCKKIFVQLKGNTIEDVNFLGGCDGNLKAIRRLVLGKDAKEVIELLRGNECRNKGTSCADQLTYALEEALKSNQI
ncbi:TIGR03905 family TSCPD domain-containing protein [Succinivibrio dextrinosolvens]|jgi:uncharacterized protein (TIGR03905 family)|uniref:TIGR03905 family TSCPD domain-containing protein n=1 Tax=Succinivibrio dextrinosolvens TaxID=83771 RepID=UPI0004E2860C|nr:TIGR03905 family TSCPD domain-containing protein [Succinivibrio dextrinosolvens]